MSTAVDERGRGAAVASVFFLALLLLSIVWPAPVVWLNAATLREPLSVDYDSFLGREAPSWDVVYWGIAGLFVLAMLHGSLHSLGESSRRFRDDLSRIGGRLRSRRPSSRWVIAGALLSALLIVVTWRYLDAPAIAMAESLQSETSQDVIRVLNRFGGGMNPVMVVLFFLIAGLIYARTLWTELAVCMMLAGGAAGIAVQVIKKIVGRSRPELWLGPFHHTWPSATSFPSGHTVGAFALASVLFFGSRSRTLRFAAMLLAAGVGVSRILAFRHWPSDVLASAILGTALGWFFVAPLRSAGSAVQADEATTVV